MVKTEQWISAQKLITIQDGIDVQRVITECKQNKKERSRFNLTDEHFIIGAVGRFSPEKNFSVLIEAFAVVHTKHPHARLLLVGYGQEEQLLRSLVSRYRLDDYVIFIVGQPAYGYYSMMDCFVLPSKSEALSLALLEAMCCGVPSILSSLEYIHDILIDKINGIVVPANTSDEFAQAIMLLINDNELRKLLALHAKKTVQRECDTSQMVSKYKKLYDVALEK
jgi:glycosyltransferase involved in cell wall biosynthesis